MAPVMGRIIQSLSSPTRLPYNSSFMAREYSLVPRKVARIESKYRKISTDLPAPGSVPILEKLHAFEPVAMRGQPPIVWDRADNFQVYDAWGNCWIDWSSGVLLSLIHI